MNSNLEKSKKRLTIILTLIVFSIFLLIWLIFFSWKYFREVQIQENEFINITNKYSFNWVDLYKLINRLNTRISLDKLQERPMPDEIRDIIVLDNKNNIIYDNTRENINFTFLSNILWSYEYNKIIKNNGFIIKKIHLKNNTGTIIFIKKMHYMNCPLESRVNKKRFTLLFLIFEYINKKYLIINNIKYDNN